MPTTLKVIGSSSFQNCPNLQNIIIPTSVTRIEDQAFYGATQSVETIDLPNLEYLGNSAFTGVRSLTRIENLGKITELLGTNSHAGSKTFASCINLQFVRLPSTLTLLGSTTTNINTPFYDCSALDTVICEATTPPVMSTPSFPSSPNTLMIYVPDASVEAYKTATNWSTYADRIKPLSEYTE